MWNCRVCSNTPFASFFGFPDSSKELSKNKKQARTSSEISSNSYETRDSPVKGAVHLKDSWEPRSPPEILTLCSSWEEYVHPRAKEFWTTSESLHQILASIARGVDKLEDPIFGGEERCVIWHGEYGDDGLPVMRIKKPKMSQEALNFVNRTLVFLYADEESFEELRGKPKGAFAMACNNPRCVNLTHISLDD